MAANSWTREENEKFKNALQLFSAFLPNRFENIAEYLQKSVVSVMEHYQELVDDLLEIRSSHISLPDELDAVSPTMYPVDRTIWNKEEHEWFLIGLKRFGKDWDKIAVLLDSKNPKQVALYAHNYFHWENAKKNVMKRRRSKDITMWDMNVDSTGQQESLVLSPSQPQQGPIALEIDQHARTSDSNHIFHDRTY